MKILAVSDQIDECIYTSQLQERFGDVDLVVSCGDLAYEYLTFKPRYFLHGHTMPMGKLASRVTRVGATTVINVFSCHLFEIEPP